MTVFTVQHNKNHAAINNAVFSDRRLSCKAKSLWLYTFSKPDDWKSRLCDLMKQSTDEIKSVRACLIELEKAGYLSRTNGILSNGKLTNLIWEFNDPTSTSTFEQRTENPTTAEP